MNQKAALGFIFSVSAYALVHFVTYFFKRDAPNFRRANLIVGPVLAAIEKSSTAIVLDCRGFDSTLFYKQFFYEWYIRGAEADEKPHWITADRSNDQLGFERRTLYRRDYEFRP
ncbi:hypothetical protein [Planococcus soli]|uniref:hypothetical protein n=1 Tax=Planococcus soli TaxID=2666072 RepID=UPI002E2BCDDD|nr:hypothetical protein [Planococcus soli]